MTTAIWVIILVFAFIVGGMITLLRTANRYKFPDTYDKSKVGFEDEDDWPDTKQNSGTGNADDSANSVNSGNSGNSEN